MLTTLILLNLQAAGAIDATSATTDGADSTAGSVGTVVAASSQIQPTARIHQRAVLALS